MKTKIRITITEKDLMAANNCLRRNDSSSSPYSLNTICPIAQAIKRELGNIAIVHVMPNEIQIQRHGETLLGYKVSRRALKLIRDFDYNRPFTLPITIDLIQVP